MRKPEPIVGPALEASQITGRGKDAWRIQGQIVGKLAGQERFFILLQPGAEGKSAIYAVIFGDEPGDGLTAVDLATAWNGPDLSPDMDTPCWVGRCRRCGHVVNVVPDDRSEGWIVAMNNLGIMVASDHVVSREPNPGEYRPICGCDHQNPEKEYQNGNDEAGGPKR